MTNLKTHIKVIKCHVYYNILRCIFIRYYITKYHELYDYYIEVIKLVSIYIIYIRLMLILNFGINRKCSV